MKSWRRTVVNLHGAGLGAFFSCRSPVDCAAPCHRCTLVSRRGCLIPLYCLKADTPLRRTNQPNTMLQTTEKNASNCTMLLCWNAMLSIVVVQKTRHEGVELANVIVQKKAPLIHFSCFFHVDSRAFTDNSSTVMRLSPILTSSEEGIAPSSQKCKTVATAAPSLT